MLGKKGTTNLCSCCSYGNQSLSNGAKATAHHLDVFYVYLSDSKCSGVHYDEKEGMSCNLWVVVTISSTTIIKDITVLINFIL